MQPFLRTVLALLTLTCLACAGGGGSSPSGTTPAPAVTDLYLGGYEENAAGIEVAKVWKNGVATALTDGTHHARVKGLAVVGADVYAVGYQDNGAFWVATLWKNGH